MITYLSGAVRNELANRPDLGFIMTPNMGNKSRAAGIWAADNGCFSAAASFNLDRYLQWLAARNPSSCLFATAPDVVGDAAQTLERSAPVLPMIRELGYKAALVAQDGLEALVIPWDSFDVLFIGGSTDWKLGAAAASIVREARARGKWVHMGRVNSFKRLKYAAELGCDSADGTYIKFGPAINGPRVCAWLDTLNGPAKLAA